MIDVGVILRDSPSDEGLRRIGLFVLRTGLVLGLGLSLLGAWLSPAVALAPPAIVIIGVVARWLFSRPQVNLIVLLVSFVAVADFKEGIQPSEIVFGLYYFAFLGHWFITRLLFYGDPLFEHRESRVAALFLIGVTMSAGVSLLFHADPLLLLGEWISISYLALYFPVRDAVSRYESGGMWIVLAVCLVGGFVLTRNLLTYQHLVSDAEYVWQIARGRAVTSTAVLLGPTILAFVFLAHERHRTRHLMLFVAFSLFALGLVLTQSRGYWLAFGIGSMIAFIVAEASAKRKMLQAGLLSAAILFALGFVVLGDLFILTMTGLVNRLLSIGTAATDDISLVNRWRETAVVFHKVLRNPIVGYGMGVTFPFYDLQFLQPVTVVKSFLHNGYLALWYKFGLWGLGLILYFWGAVIHRGLRVYRFAMSTRLRIIGLGSSIFLLSLTIAAITSNPFNIDDPMFMFAIMAGLAGGAFDRGRMEDLQDVAVRLASG